MLKIEKKVLITISIIVLLAMIVFTILDWDIDTFEFLKVQKYEFYFQSWVSVSGLIFSMVMSITTFFIYAKNKLPSMKFLSISFLLSSFSYLIIGYHASYCKLCSDLSLCSAGHNYSNSFTIIALIILVLTILLMNLKNSIVTLKLFSYGLIVGSFLVLITLFVSLQFMVMPDFLFYELSTINLQGFVFIFPLILIALSFIYFIKTFKITKSVISVFSLLFISFLPQAYHIFVCKECDIMECSEFYIFSGIIMYMAIGFIIYAISLELKKKS